MNRITPIHPNVNAAKQTSPRAQACGKREQARESQQAYSNSRTGMDKMGLERGA